MMICRGLVDNILHKKLRISLSKSQSRLSAEAFEIFFLSLNALTGLSTFPQFGAKLISLYLFSVKNCEKVSKNLIISMWISSFCWFEIGMCGYLQTY